MQRWVFRVFAYVLATTEVNANLAEAEFGDKDIPLPILDFRRQLAKELIQNPTYKKEQEKVQRRSSKRLRTSETHVL